MGFYTYLHCRPDGTPFYVGKGKGKRAFNLLRRNPHHRNVVTKYGANNILVFVFPCESEDEALSDEIQQIAQLRAAGFDLANQTDGGDGVSNPSPLVRSRIAKGQKGKVRSAEHCAKLSASLKGRKYSEADRLALSASLKRRYEDPLARAKTADAMRLACAVAGTQEKKSVASRLMWANDEYRSKMRNMKEVLLPKGELCSWSKLTERDVLAIRAKRAAGVPLAQVAEEHRISKGTASEIANRKLWKHLP